jgi:hypothetical protein
MGVLMQLGVAAASEIEAAGTFGFASGSELGLLR